MNDRFSLLRSGGAALAGGLLSAAAMAQTVSSDPGAGSWHFAGTLYLYVPSVSGKSSVPAGGDSTFEFDVLEHLKFTVMGSLEAHNGRWGAFTDLIYLDFGDHKSATRKFTIGGSALPLDTTADLKWRLEGVSWTVGAQYRISSSPTFTFDVLGGARVLDIKRSSSWTISGDLGPLPPASRTGSNKEKSTLLDGIVGLRARATLGEGSAWSVPFYVDIGTGDSKRTWQAATGIRYAFGWGDVSALYRVLDYELKSGEAIEQVRFNGPMVGATFRW
jgi:hypothetical protein